LRCKHGHLRRYRVHLRCKHGHLRRYLAHWETKCPSL
jgi:hypothetical protein